MNEKAAAIEVVRRSRADRTLTEVCRSQSLRLGLAVELEVPPA